VDGVVVFDAQGQLIQENAAQQRLEGRDAAPDFREMPLAERLALFAARDEHDRPLGLDEGPLPRALRGEIVTGVETMGLLARTLDGREVELSVSAAPLRDQAGYLTGAVAVFRDQTEQKRLERDREAAHAKAEQQAAQLVAIFEAMTDGVVVFDKEGHLIRENAAHRLLLGFDKVLPHVADVPLSERRALFPTYDEHGHLLGPGEGPLARALRGEVVSSGKTMDLHARSLDGQEVEMGVSAVPLWNREGQVTGAVGIFRDQT
jgi:PAS domain-containing protein